jgi:hypothetical protein
LLGIAHQTGQLRDLWPDLVGNVAPLSACGYRCVLSEGRGNERGYDAPSALARMSQCIAHEVHPATLPRDALAYLGTGRAKGKVAVD